MAPIISFTFAAYKEAEDEGSRQYANRPFTKRCIGKALGIEKGTAGNDRKIFTAPGMVYDPNTTKWLNGDKDLDPKIKATFDAFTGPKWFEHLKECKADKEAERKEEEERKEKERRALKKTAKKRAYQSDSDSSGVLDSEEEREMKRRLKKAKARKAEGGEAGASRPKKLKKLQYDSDDIDGSS